MDPVEQFEEERRARLEAFGKDAGFRNLSRDWLEASMGRQYVYNFNWLGRPIIQYPQDIMAMQELIWRVRPDLIIETGIAHGGSIVMSASMLALLDYADALAEGRMLDPAAPRRKVIGVDIDIRAHNRALIEAHPMANRIGMIEGSSVAPDVVDQVRQAARGHERVMVCLDSMHTHDHVVQELEAYAPLVSVGSYCVVFDTFVEDMPKGFFKDRPWDPGDNPKTAVREYLKTHPEFEIDRQMDDQLQISVAPEGFLKRVR